MTNQILERFLSEHDYDIRKSGNGRWIDQKCALDAVCFVADCIMDYVQNDGKQPFQSPDIWHSEYAIENVQHLFGKPDPTIRTTLDEYNKFFNQPCDILSDAFHVGLHQLKQERIKSFFLLVIQLFISFCTDITKMVKAHAFTFFEHFCHFIIFFIHKKEGVQISLIGCCKGIAYVAGIFSFLDPVSHGIGCLCIFFHFIHQGNLAGSKHPDLFIQFLVDLYIMSF